MALAQAGNLAFDRLRHGAVTGTAVLLNPDWPATRP